MKRILIVDDSKLNLMVAQEALCESYEVTAVTTGAQALEFLKDNDCNLILLDINMPEMDGFEVMHCIQQMEERKDIPIIFLTADDSAAAESRCLEEGAQDFIVKPFVKQVMLSRIGRLLELEELRAELAARLEKKTLEVIDMQSRALRDALTGLWNRSYAEKLVNEKLKKGDCGAVFMMDMDNFKAINDSYGHLAGDKTLMMFAETLTKYAGEQDIISRIGGDEFVMYIAGNLSEDELRRRANDIIEEMDKRLTECEFDTNSSVSVGIAQASTDGQDFSTLYSAADKALYYVKQNGKKSYHFFSDQKKMESDRAANLVDLRQISELMSRTDNGKGVYKLDYDNFHHIYNFIKRFVDRNHKEVCTVLFTAHSDKGAEIDIDELEQSIKYLELAVYNSLRKVDVATRYSTKQVIVMLMDSNRENSKMVAERILEKYTELYQEQGIYYEYGLADMGYDD